MNALPFLRARPLTPPRVLADVDGRTAALVELARRAGCTVTATGRTIHACGRAWEAIDLACRDNTEALRLLNGLSDFYAWGLPGIHPDPDPAVLRLADGFQRSAYASRVGPIDAPHFIAKKIHRFVQDTVHFQDEKLETFRSPELTMQLCAGDCDDHAVLVAAIAKACGIPGYVAGFGEGITHVAPVLEHGRMIADTSIKQGGGAAYGEHPFAAAQRLHLRALRTDLAS